MVLRPEAPVRAGAFEVVLVRDPLGAESFAVNDLEGDHDHLVLATNPLTVRPRRNGGDGSPLADTG